MDRYLELAFEAPARYRVTFGRRVNEDDRFPALEPLARRAYTVLMRALGEVRAASEPEVLNAVFALW